MWPVTGQTRIVNILQRSLDSNNLSHAYLFTGPAHIGKMTLAKSLAKALNCTGAQQPCNQCLSCQKIEEGIHSDVQVIELNVPENEEEKAKSKISSEQIEDIQHIAYLPPFEGRCKVFIIDGAEFMSGEAANRLLKTLEEPPPNVVFILLSANENGLLQTIISRCMKLELAPLSRTEMEAALVERNVEPAQAKLLSRLAGGRLGWAIHAAAKPEILDKRNEEIEDILTVSGASYEDRFTYAGKLATQFSRNRAAVIECLEQWRDWWHDMLLVKTGSGANATSIDREEALSEMSRRLSLPQIKNTIVSIQSTMADLNHNASPRLALEVLMLAIPEMKNG